MWSTQTVAFSLSLLLGSPGFFSGKNVNYILVTSHPLRWWFAHSKSRHHPSYSRQWDLLSTVIKQTHAALFCLLIKCSCWNVAIDGFHILLEALTNLPSSFSSVAVKLVKESCVAGDPRTSSLMTRLYSPSQDRYICFNQKGKVRAMVSSHTIFLFTHKNLQLTNIFAGEGASKVLFAAHTFTLLFLSGNHYHMQFWLLLSKTFTQLLPSICILT